MGSIRGNQSRLLSSLLCTFMFTVLAATVIMILVTGSDEGKSNSVADIGMTVGVFGVIVAIMQAGYSISTLLNWETQVMSFACLGYAVVMIGMLSLVVVTMGMHWYADKEDGRRTDMTLVGTAMIVLAVGQVVRVAV